MEDIHIVELYWKRDESAISESQTKYGGYCSVIADNILHSAEDTKECVNDTYLKVWNVIPPQRPQVWPGGRGLGQKSGRPSIPCCEFQFCIYILS